MAFAVVVGTAVAAFGFGALPGEMRDFEVYWTAASRAQDAAPLYRVEDGHYQFKYLPAFAVLAAPMALAPLPLAKAAWFVISAGALVALIWSSIAVLSQRRRSAWVIAAVVVVAMAKFYGHELVLGQVNLLFAALAVAGLLLLKHGRDGAAAALMVLAVVVKPYAVLLLPWLVYVRGRRALAAALVGVAAVLLLPILLYAPAAAFDLYRGWWTTVTESTAPNLTNADNVSVAAFFAKWIGAGAIASLAAVVVSAGLLIVAVAAIVRGRGLPGREGLEGALLLTLIPLLSPQGWDYVFLLSTPAIALLANHDDQLPGPWRAAVWAAIATIGLSLFDVMGRQRYATFMAWSVITVCFLVVAGGLLTLRLRRAA